MSELKAIKIELNNHGKPIASIQGSTSYYGISPNDTFYSQEEADKVIAELIEKNERLSDDCLIKASNTFREIEKEIRHHEYKRCLAMYRYCAIKALYELDFKGNDVEWKWYSKWMHKWFKLAKKFKEGIQNGMR